NALLQAERNEELLEQLGHAAAIRVENDTWTTQINVMQQGHLFGFWRAMRKRCYNSWMEEVDNDSLSHAHEVLQEVVGRCRTQVRERSNHVKLTAVCHEEIVMAYERCQSAKNKKVPAAVPSEPSHSAVRAVNAVVEIGPLRRLWLWSSSSSSS
ncbi:unnamed protein product, partial [Polarella glacialis]